MLQMMVVLHFLGSRNRHHVDFVAIRLGRAYGVSFTPTGMLANTTFCFRGSRTAYA